MTCDISGRQREGQVNTHTKHIKRLLLDLSREPLRQFPDPFFRRLEVVVGKEDRPVIVAKLVDYLVKDVRCKSPNSVGAIDCDTAPPVEIHP